MTQKYFYVCTNHSNNQIKEKKRVVQMGKKRKRKEFGKHLGELRLEERTSGPYGAMSRKSKTKATGGRAGFLVNGLHADNIQRFKRDVPGAFCASTVRDLTRVPPRDAYVAPYSYIGLPVFGSSHLYSNASSSNNANFNIFFTLFFFVFIRKIQN